MAGRTLVAIAGIEGDIWLINQHLEAATGLTLADMMGHPIWQTLPAPEFAEAMRATYLKAVNGELVEDQQGAWLTKEGSAFKVNLDYSAMRDTEGQIRGVVITASDERQARVQAELSEVRDRYQAILD